MVLSMEKYTWSNLSWLGLGSNYCMFLLIIYFEEKIRFVFRVLKNIVELMVVILVLEMYMQYQCLMMMSNKVFLLPKLLNIFYWSFLMIRLFLWIRMSLILKLILFVFGLCELLCFLCLLVVNFYRRNNKWINVCISEKSILIKLE
jgi:hypothetical protein